MLRSLRAVTLTELLIAVVLVGIIAGFGIPNYNKVREKSAEKEALDSLRLISEALDLYKLRNGDFPGFNMPEVSDINTTLILGIIEQNIDYSCAVDAEGYKCTADPTSYDWEIHGEKGLNNGNPHCSAEGVDDCPSCPGVGCMYPGFME